jgi:pantoate--beta-alanine ligase
MARELDIPIEVIGCPTVREASGLAMSSRNLRLSQEALDKAARLYTEKQSIADGLQQAEHLADLTERSSKRLLQDGFTEIEYLELASAIDLKPLDRPSEAARLCAAAWMDGIRLIDNIEIPAMN